MINGENFESMAECLEEFAKSDPTFLVMDAILKMVQHARCLRGLVVEMAVGLEDERLSREVFEILE